MNTNTEQENIDAIDKLFESINHTDCSGAVVGVAHKGKVIYRKAFGMASIQHGIANTPTTIMRIGSTSKQFTCLGALLLAEQGKLDIDAPVTTYLPELPTHKTVPSLRQFMTHTSGYRCTVDLGTTFNGMARQPLGWTLRTLSRQQNYNFEPNESQIYCNGGYHLLSIAIDRAAGMPMEEFLKLNVFEPLGMFDTMCLPSDHTLIPGFATLHVPNHTGGYDRGAFSWDDVRGEGNMISTIDDMLIWLDHLNGEKHVGSKESWHQMFESPTLANGLKSVYSLGLHRNQYRGITVIHHAGSVIGGNSQMLTVPDYELDIIVIANGVNINCSETAKGIVDILLAEKLTQPKPKVASFEQFSHLANTKYYGHKSGVLIGFGRLNDMLGFSYMNSQLLPVLRAEKGGLFAGFEDVALGPLLFTDLEADLDGSAPASITYSEAGVIEVLERVSNSPIPTRNLDANFIGNFYSHDANAEASITLEDSDLVLTIRGDYSSLHKFKIESYSDDAFGAVSLDSPGSAFAISLRKKGRTVSSFEVNTIRGRHLEFARK